MSHLWLHLTNTLCGTMNCLVPSNCLLEFLGLVSWFRASFCIVTSLVTSPGYLSLSDYTFCICVKQKGRVLYMATLETCHTGFWISDHITPWYQGLHILMLQYKSIPSNHVSNSQRNSNDNLWLISMSTTRHYSNLTFKLHMDCVSHVQFVTGILLVFAYQEIVKQLYKIGPR